MKSINIEFSEIIASEQFTKPTDRYSEFSLVKKLQDLGIGRPSTYANMLSVIQERNYVVKDTRKGKPHVCQIITLKKDKQIEVTSETSSGETEKNKLFPTDLGKLVDDFLQKHFSSFINYTFTAN